MVALMKNFAAHTAMMTMVVMEMSKPGHLTLACAAVGGDRAPR